MMVVVHHDEAHPPRGGEPAEDRVLGDRAGIRQKILGRQAFCQQLAGRAYLIRELRGRGRSRCDGCGRSAAAARDPTRSRE